MRKHLSYANVVATLALVFAMSGGALAAKHYLLNSVGQINPRVLKSLRSTPTVTRLWAQVTGNGTAEASSPGVQARRFGTGAYEVAFPQQVSGCAPEVTEAGLPGRWSGGYRPEMAEGAAIAVLAAPGGHNGDANPSSSYPSGDAVQVRTHGPTGQLADSAFFIAVTC
jgi:hypothetical protein